MDSALAPLLALASSSSTAPPLSVGTVVSLGSDRLGVNVAGADLEARWLPGAGVPEVDDVVLCARVDGKWYALGASRSQPVEPEPPPPPRGTVTSVPTGSSTISVSVTGHGTMSCPFLDSYDPAVGHEVVLTWPESDEVPTVLGALGSTPPPKPPRPPREPTPPPSNPTPPPRQTGTSRYRARSSRSRLSTGWSSNHGNHLTQGSWGSLTFRGYWFYGTGLVSGMRGRTVTRLRIRLPARRRMGNYNQSVQIRIYRHTATTRPSGAPALVAGPVTVTIPPNAGARWVTLPASWGRTIAENGGGLAISGGAYAGLVGVGSGSGFDAQSGLLEFTWRR